MAAAVWEAVPCNACFAGLCRTQAVLEDMRHRFEGTGACSKAAPAAATPPRGAQGPPPQRTAPATSTSTYEARSKKTT